MKTEILLLAENLLNFQFHDDFFFPLGMVLKRLNLEAASWPIFIALKKKLENAK
jgi:hypothetical protein